jgi:hemolysin III
MSTRAASGLDEGQQQGHQLGQLGHQLGHQLGDGISAVIEEVKPRLRGWLHLVTSPLTVAAGIVLVVLSPTPMARTGSAVFAGTAALLFTVSALYHRGHWGPRTWAALRRFDHANIFLLIAGSYTPFTLLMLEGRSRVELLSIVWGGALLGVLFRVFWTGAPRWLYIPVYMALGWAAVLYSDEFAAAGSGAVFALVVAGGALYTLGGVVYGLRKPDPFPSWFGFHEVFHTFTVLAFAAHYVGVSLATYSLR